VTQDQPITVRLAVRSNGSCRCYAADSQRRTSTCCRRSWTAVSRLPFARFRTTHTFRWTLLPRRSGRCAASPRWSWFRSVGRRYRSRPRAPALRGRPIAQDRGALAGVFVEHPLDPWRRQRALAGLIAGIDRRFGVVVRSTGRLTDRDAVARCHRCRPLGQARGAGHRSAPIRRGVVRERRRLSRTRARGFGGVTDAGGSQQR
jgi:hypothetical protein